MELSGRMIATEIGLVNGDLAAHDASASENGGQGTALSAASRRTNTRPNA